MINSKHRQPRILYNFCPLFTFIFALANLEKQASEWVFFAFYRSSVASFKSSFVFLHGIIIQNLTGIRTNHLSVTLHKSKFGRGPNGWVKRNILKAECLKRKFNSVSISRLVIHEHFWILHYLFSLSSIKVHCVLSQSTILIYTRHFSNYTSKIMRKVRVILLAKK